MPRNTNRPTNYVVQGGAPITANGAGIRLNYAGVTTGRYGFKKVQPMRFAKKPNIAKFISRLQHDDQGNLYYDLKKDGYAIVVSSDKEASKYIMLCEIGKFYTSLERIDNSVKKAAIDITKYGIMEHTHEWDTNANVLLRWFVPNRTTDKKQLGLILTGKVFYYKINVSVRKYGLELINYAANRNHSHMKLRNTDPISEIIDNINIAIQAAVDNAKRKEHALFNSTLDFEGNETRLPYEEDDGF